MNHLQNAVLAVIFFNTLLLAGCQQDSQEKVLRQMPESRTLSYNQIMYVENDGRCDAGQVIKVTGGKKSKGIARKYECVSRPQ